MTENKDTHKGHRQRLKERAFTEGLASFNPHQVMELLLFYAIPVKDVSEIAHNLIKEFGSVSAVLSAPKEELVKISGVGANTADWLLRVGELVESYGALSSTDRPSIENFRSAMEFCRAHGRPVPSTWQICMTPAGIVQLFSKVCDSLAWGEPAPLKQSIDDVLAMHARNAIIVEFTQDTIPHVEEEDRTYAKEYGSILWMMGAELLDVIIVGTEGILSMHGTGDYDRSQFGAAKSVLAQRYLREAPLEDDNEELPISDDGL